MYEQVIEDIKASNVESFVKIILSDSGDSVERIIVRPVLIKNIKKWQFEQFEGSKVFHTNVDFDMLVSYLDEVLTRSNFRNINIIMNDSTISYRVSKKQKLFKSVAKNTSEKEIDLSHNRQKEYIFEEGMPIEPLVDLGVFDKNYHLIKSKNDKYKQINRFIEIIADEFKNIDKDNITILDFGCGKSYLTFLIYYYFTKIKNVSVNIVGYDLKEDVVNSCNDIAKKYNYENLKFVVGNVGDMQTFNGQVDMMVTLHACDIATDYALHFAIKNHIPYIFSVPCCQHEINAQIRSDSELSLLLEYGLYKERFSALLTDVIRCSILENYGYTVNVVEFIDFEHTPKNAMIRAKLVKNNSKKSSNNKLEKLISDFNLSQTLVNLLKNDDK